MGIRVKKLVGYGLTDLTGPEDERINQKGYLNRHVRGEDEERWSATGYGEFLKKHGCRALDHHPGSPFSDLIVFRLGASNKKPSELDKLWDPWDSIHYDDEFGLKNVLVVIPFCMAVRDGGDLWIQRDTTVDYCEEAHVYNCERRIVELPDGIHPWNSSFEDDNGERVPIWKVQLSRAEKAREQYKVRVPDEVRALCCYLELFKDPKTARTMKPLLYVYWA